MVQVVHMVYLPTADAVLMAVIHFSRHYCHSCHKVYHSINRIVCEERQMRREDFSFCLFRSLAISLHQCYFLLIYDTCEQSMPIHSPFHPGKCS